MRRPRVVKYSIEVIVVVAYPHMGKTRHLTAGNLWLIAFGLWNVQLPVGRPRVAIVIVLRWGNKIMWYTWSWRPILFLRTVITDLFFIVKNQMQRKNSYIVWNSVLTSLDHVFQVPSTLGPPEVGSPTPPNGRICPSRRPTGHWFPEFQAFSNGLNGFPVKIIVEF